MRSLLLDWSKLHTLIHAIADTVYILLVAYGIESKVIIYIYWEVLGRLLEFEFI
jgi:hypothetical protein